MERFEDRPFRVSRKNEGRGQRRQQRKLFEAIFRATDTLNDRL